MPANQGWRPSQAAIGFVLAFVLSVILNAVKDPEEVHSP
jgi:hypothetical protein